MLVVLVLIHPGAGRCRLNPRFNPQALLGEIDQLRSRNIPVAQNLLISDRAHVIFPYHIAEEICLLPSAPRGAARRFMAGLSLRLVAWGALAAGVLYLHSGEILMVLLTPYFVLLHVLQRRGMDIVRQETGSVAATAVFGAILLAGFCLVIFPVT